MSLLLTITPVLMLSDPSQPQLHQEQGIRRDEIRNTLLSVNQMQAHTDLVPIKACSTLAIAWRQPSSMG